MRQFTRNTHVFCILYLRSDISNLLKKYCVLRLLNVLKVSSFLHVFFLFLQLICSKILRWNIIICCFFNVNVSKSIVILKILFVLVFVFNFFLNSINTMTKKVCRCIKMHNTIYHSLQIKEEISMNKKSICLSKTKNLTWMLSYPASSELICLSSLDCFKWITINLLFLILAYFRHWFKNSKVILLFKMIGRTIYMSNLCQSCFIFECDYSFWKPLTQWK